MWTGLGFLLAYRSDSLERSIQFVNVCEDMLEALTARSAGGFNWGGRRAGGRNTYHGNITNESLSLLLKVCLFPWLHSECDSLSIQGG